MNFNTNQSIYLQIADWVCDQVLTGKIENSQRLLSVRELGGKLEVNPNTVLRSYDYLQSQEIINNKRGVGYFIDENATQKIISLRKEKFFKEDAPTFFRNMKLLNISIEDIVEAHNQFDLEE